MNSTDIINYNNIEIFEDGYNKPLFYNEEAKRYVKMEYISRKSDWSDGSNNDSISKVVEAEQCSLKHF